MTVLIAEDISLMRELLKSFLRPIATKIIETGSMAETEALIIRDPTIDLICLDLRFPDSTYLGTISKIGDFRVFNPHAIIIVITGNTDPTFESKAIEAGAHGFMFKPAVSKPDTFLSTLSALANSIVRQPTKYTQNLELAEKLVEKLVPHMPTISDSPVT